MKKFTRLLCLVLCLALLSACPAVLVGCDDSGLPGAYINMYLSSEVYNFDPAYAYLDSSATKVLGLMYEGLMRLDDNGKVVKALCDEWKYKVDEGLDPNSADDDTYTMEIKIKTSAWSDGTALSAEDFVYSWKRLLEPDFDSDAAELLYDVKGAIERKTLAESPDDIGLYADKQVLTIEFAHSIDPDEFLRKCASIALVPLRESNVSYYDDWSSASTTILTNGPFTLRANFPGQKLVLERNTYYKYDTSEDEDPTPKKYVTPYRITVDYTLNSEEIMQKYSDGDLFFLGELPADTEIRNQYKSKVSVSDSYAMCMYYFNTDKAPFNDPTVRTVLSEVIDREAIVQSVVFAKAATGMLPSAVNDLTGKDSFAANSTSKLSTTACDISSAKQKLTAAGIDPKSYGTLYLTVRAACDSTQGSDNGADYTTIKNKDKNKMSQTVDVMVAEMVVEQWNKLGFDFELKMVNAQDYKETTSELVQFSDTVVDTLYGADTAIKGGGTISYEARSFDVIALDYQMLDTKAFSLLSVFAQDFSGCQLNFDVNSEQYEMYQSMGHVTGYNSAEYNTLIAEAYQAYINGDNALLSEKLHKAEETLLKDMPVIPIFEYQNVTLKSSKLSNVESTGWGYMIFNKTKLKNWKDHIPDDEDDK